MQLRWNRGEKRGPEQKHLRTGPRSASPCLARPAFAMFAVLLASYVINAMDRQLFPLLASDVRQEYGFSLAKHWAFSRRYLR